MMKMTFDDSLSSDQQNAWIDLLQSIQSLHEPTGELVICSSTLPALKDFNFWLERAVKRMNVQMVEYDRLTDSYRDLGVRYVGDQQGQLRELPLIRVGTKPCLFLDRDGVINVDDQYIYRKEDVCWMPGITEGLKEVSLLGIELVVLTNQSGVGRGYYKESDVLSLHQWMQEEMAKNGVDLKYWYYCPYHPKASDENYLRESPLRKPGSAMAEMAFEDLDIDPYRSIMIGDKASDQLNHLDLKTYFIQGSYELPKGSTIINKVDASLFS